MQIRLEVEGWFKRRTVDQRIQQRFGEMFDSLENIEIALRPENVEKRDARKKLEEGLATLESATRLLYELCDARGLTDRGGVRKAIASLEAGIKENSPNLYRGLRTGDIIHAFYQQVRAIAGAILDVLPE